MAAPGSGYAICKQLVEQVDGTISVDSHIGQGSKFRIEVPIEHVLPNSPLTLMSQMTAIVQHIVLRRFKPALLASAQSPDNFVVRHIQCRSKMEFEAALSDIDLKSYNVALIV